MILGESDGAIYLCLGISHVSIVPVAALDVFAHHLELDGFTSLGDGDSGDRFLSHDVVLVVLNSDYWILN